MPETNGMTTQVVEAIQQTAHEAHQLETIFERLLQVLEQNGFQIQVDLVSVAQKMYQRLEAVEQQARGWGISLSSWKN